MRLRWSGSRFIYDYPEEDTVHENPDVAAADEYYSRDESGPLEAECPCPCHHGVDTPLFCCNDS